MRFPHTGEVALTELALADDAIVAMHDATREEKMRARLAEHRRASQLNAGMKPVEISEVVLDKIRAADEARETAMRLQTADPKGNRKAIAEHLNKAKRLDMEATAIRHADTEDAWRRSAELDTALTAIRHGVELVTEEVMIQTRVRGENGEQLYHRDGPNKGEPVMQTDRVSRTLVCGGLAHAMAKGDLDGAGPEPEVLFSIGRIYGEAYEISVGKLTAQGGGGGSGPRGPQPRLVEAGETLVIMRRELTRRQYAILDLVCGEGLKAWQAAEKIGAGRPAAMTALRDGLMQALKNWTEAQKVGEQGRAVERVRAASRQIENLRL